MALPDFFNEHRHTTYGTPRFFFVSLAAIAGAITTLVASLGFILYWSQVFMDSLGYRFALSDEVKKALVAVTGVVSVAVVALFGVRSQNISAERRHRVDASLELKKDTFIDVSVAFASQYQHLLGSATGSSGGELKTMALSDVGKAHARLQMVASQKTIFAMLEANREWGYAIAKLGVALSPEAKPVERVERLLRVQEAATPFMEAVWRFQIIARAEIGSAFDDDDAYYREMRRQFATIAEFYETLKAKIPTEPAPSKETQVASGETH